jgi:hypothetical protein
VKTHSHFVEKVEHKENSEKLQGDIDILRVRPERASAPAPCAERRA